MRYKNKGITSQQGFYFYIITYCTRWCFAVFNELYTTFIALYIRIYEVWELSASLLLDWRNILHCIFNVLDPVHCIKISFPKIYLWSKFSWNMPSGSRKQKCKVFRQTIGNKQSKQWTKNGQWTQKGAYWSFRQLR